jgi:hypothetical protein
MMLLEQNMSNKAQSQLIKAQIAKTTVRAPFQVKLITIYLKELINYHASG